MERRTGSLEGVGLNPDFWQGKRVLVTGHTGFKGSWLSLWLQNLGAQIVGYSLPPPTQPNLFEIAEVANGMTSLTGDIRDLKNFKNVLQRHQPEILFHLAAQSLVRYSYNHPVETYSTNVIGTLNVLEASRGTKNLRVLTIVTSDKCYENNETPKGYKEDEPMGGYDPYSNSKGCAELVVSAYRNSFFPVGEHARHGVSVSTGRAGNVIGGGDWSSDRLIPDIMNSILKKNQVQIRNPEATRPWQFVLDPLNGYLTLAEHQWDKGSDFSEGWNFGPDGGGVKPVSWIVENISRYWGEDINWKLDTANNPHEAKYLQLDCSKAKSKLGWISKLPLPTGLEWTVGWYKNYQQNEDMRRLTLEDISRYQKLQS